MSDTFRIEVESVGQTVTGTSKAGKPFKKFELVFHSNGKKSTRQITQYSDVYKVLGAAAPEQLFTITTKQEGEYKEWVKAEPVSEADKAAAVAEAKASAPNKGTSTSRNTYETPEERNARQEQIARAGAINSALEFAKCGGSTSWSVNGILEIAEQFRTYIRATPVIEVPRVE